MFISKLLFVETKLSGTQITVTRPSLGKRLRMKRTQPE